jgi:hypothetical protein
MKKFFAILLMFVVSTAVEASIVSVDFETSEGYPATSGDGTNVWLQSHGWYDTSSTWAVPYITTDTFANTGSRSAKVWAANGLGQQWCNYHADWTPSTNANTVSYSAYMAFQPNPINGGTDSTSYGGIALRGKKADLTEVTLGGIQLRLDGTVDVWGGTYTNTTSYTAALGNWDQLAIKANFENNTVQFLLNGNIVGSTSFSSDVVTLSSIALYCGAGDKWNYGNIIRYDTINVNAIPEPATVGILSLGALIMIRRKKH